MRTLGVVGLAGVILFVSACGDPSGCQDFEAKSAPLAVGGSEPAELEIVNGGWSSPDLAGRLWDGAETPVPAGAPDDGVLRGTVTLVEGEVADDGELRSGVVRVDLAELGTVTFSHTIGCM